MRFTDLFIKRPVLASVVSILIFFLGLKALLNLDVRQFPKVENTVITVTTVYPGATADLIKGFITQPIQTAVASADGIDYISSSSRQSVSIIKLKLRLNFDSAAAFADILAKVNSVSNQLPSDSQLPVITKSTGSSLALMYINYSSDKLSSSQIYDYLNRVVQPKLQSVFGVAEARILGGNPFAMRIWLDPIKMAALKITAGEVRSALTENNYLSAAGQLKGKYTLITINAQTDIHTAKEFENLVIKQVGHNVVYLKDLASIELGSESYSSSVSFNGSRGVFLGVYGLPTANPLTVISDVRKVLPEIEGTLPPTLTQSVVYDSTEFISTAIHDVVKTLVEAAFIVMVVIFLFLGSLRSVAIPVVTIPLSLVGVAFVMYLLGYSINLLTLLAMVLAIGLVVDDAIVVVENIHRHMEEGKNAMESTLIGAREITMPVISMTITLAAVYAPIGLMGGLTGALFKEFAFTLAASVIVSGVVALTLSPMMCSLILKRDTDPNSFTHKIDHAFGLIQAKYRNALSYILPHKASISTFGGIILISVVFLFILTPKELAPVEDQGFLFGLTTAPSYANVHYLEKFSNEINNVFNKFPEHKAHFIINGADTENSGFAGVIFKTWSERKKTAKELQTLIQAELQKISGIQIFLISMPDLPTGSDGMPVQFVIKSERDYKYLYEMTQEFIQKAKKSGYFLFVDSNLKFEKPQLDIKINTEKAGQIGISSRQIGDTLNLLLGGNFVNRFSMEGRSYKVIPQLPDQSRYNPDDLKKTYIKNKSGDLIPLANFISFSTSTQPTSLEQFNQLNSVTVSGMIMIGQNQGACVNYLTKLAKEVLPKGTLFEFSGDSRAFLAEGNNLIYTFLFALLMIFLVLAAQFESFRDPLIILVSVPMAICGALIPLNIGLATINIYTEIGLVTLIGLISKHGILMVEFANQLRVEKNLMPFEAILEAACVRLRPILMTTAAMVLGVIPLVIAKGAGAASRHDLGIVIATGMTIGTLFTLFVLPTIYTIITKKDLN